MSNSSGGIADKLGNRYEGLWVTYKLLQLLAEELAAVQLEAIGDDEQGVDLWVTHCDGTREAQQCKRKNRTTGKWGIGELDRQQVLKNLGFQLGRNPSARFTFVSALPAPELRELCDTARLSGADSEAYFSKTLAIGAHEKHLRQFCRAAGISEYEPDGRLFAFDLLRRTFTHLFEDSQEGKASVAVLARCLIAGNSKTAIEVLANFAQDRLGELITIDQVRQHLCERGLSPVHLSGNPQTAEQVERLRVQFREWLRPTLIHSALVPRPEAGSVLSLITSTTGPRLVVIHGRSGTGKSCVLLQLTELLEMAGVPYLPLRLDRRTPQTSSLRYGIDGCGLLESPAVVLHCLNPGRRTVLIVDQLDAVRWTAAHASAPWEACREVIDDALGLSDMAVVVACRTFDLRDDQQIRAWHAARSGREVLVGDLGDEVVEETVATAGGNYAALTSRQKSLLRSPLHLALWVQVVETGGKATGWTTQTELLRAFWQSRFDTAARMGVPAGETRDAVRALVVEMDQRGDLKAPARILDSHPRAAAALKSLHVVVETDRYLNFTHQSYFEYQLATRLLDRVRAGGGSIVDWVQASDQTLLRREQLRLTLTLLRDEHPAEYIRTIHGLLLAPPNAVRFHLRQLALRLLGESSEPTPAESDLVFEFASLPCWRAHVLDQVFTREPAWFVAMDDRGLVVNWLASDDGQLVDSAIQICRWWSKHWGDRIAKRVMPYLDRSAPWSQRLGTVFPFSSADDSPELFQLRLLLVQRGVFRHSYLMAKELSERNPERLIDLLAAHLDHRHSQPDPPNTIPSYERDFPHYIPLHESEHLERVADTLAREFWERLIPLVIRCCEATREDHQGRQERPFFFDRTWPPLRSRYRNDPNVELLTILARAGARLVTEDPARFGTEFAAWLNHGAFSIQYTLGLALAQTGNAAADLAIGWLCDNPCRLSLPNDRGNRWGIGQGIVRQHAAVCSRVLYARLEQAILRYHEPDERRSVEWQRESFLADGWIRRNDVGMVQHALLSCLPAERLSVTAKSKAGVLDRKFGRLATDYDLNHWNRIGTMVAPIPLERCARISDRRWLQIIARADWSDSPRYRNVNDHSMADTSAEGFSRLLGERAKWEPGRFATLALAIPNTADPSFLSAILHAVAATAPPTTDNTDWIPATDHQVRAIIEYVGYRTEPRLGNSVCWLMRLRPAALSTSPSREILRRYATDHPDPSPEWTGTVRGHEPEYDWAAMNCTRGIALEAVAQLLFADPCLVGEFVATLQTASADPHPAVRVAAVTACLPILNIDRDLAVELFLAACNGPEEMLAARRVAEFFRYAQRSHHCRLEPLLRRMAESNIPAVATSGAAWLTLAALFNRFSHELVADFARGTEAQRKGVAAAAAQNCDDPALVTKCAELLDGLIDDPDDGVREKASEFLHKPNVFRLPAMRQLAARFAAGRDFGRHSSWLFEALRQHPDSLIPLVPVFEAVCERVATDLTDASLNGERQVSFELDRFVPLILRLYEQSEQVHDKRLRTACLDWWDRLLEARMGGVVQILGDLDASAMATM